MRAGFTGIRVFSLTSAQAYGFPSNTLFALPRTLKHFPHSGDLDVRELLVQQLFIGKVKDALGYPDTKGREEFLRPFFAEVRVCGNLAWKFSDAAGLELLHAVIGDSELLS